MLTYNLCRAMMIIYIHIHMQWWWYVFMQSNEAAPLVHCAPASILLPHVAGYFRRPRGAFRSFFNDDHDDDVKNIARTIRFLCQSTNILGILKTVNVPNRDSGTLPLYTNVAWVFQGPLGFSPWWSQELTLPQENCECTSITIFIIFAINMIIIVVSDASPRDTSESNSIGKRGGSEF